MIVSLALTGIAWASELMFVIGLLIQGCFEIAWQRAFDIVTTIGVALMFFFATDLVIVLYVIFLQPADTDEQSVARVNDECCGGG